VPDRDRGSLGSGRKKLPPSRLRRIGETGLPVSFAPHRRSGCGFLAGRGSRVEQTCRRL